MVNPHRNSTAQKFGCNGKELNDEFGIQWHDFGAINYDAALGRWMNLVTLAEQMCKHSSYYYAFNNLLRFIDLDGIEPDDVIINGKLSQEVFEQLQAKFDGQ